MGKDKPKEKKKACPQCGSVITSGNVFVKVKGWKAYYRCSHGHETPTQALRS